MMFVPVGCRAAVVRWCFGCLLLVGGAVPAQVLVPLPPEVEAALARARLPRDALSVLVVDAQGGRQAPRLAHREQVQLARPREFPRHRELPRASKRELAQQLVADIAARLAQRSRAGPQRHPLPGAGC